MKRIKIKVPYPKFTNPVLWVLFTVGILMLAVIAKAFLLSLPYGKISSNVAWYILCPYFIGCIYHLAGRAKDADKLRSDLIDLNALVMKYVPDPSAPEAGLISPTEFVGMNVRVGENQQGVEPLPAYMHETGDVFSCWRIDAAAMRTLINTRCIWLCQHVAPGAHLQPIYVSAVQLLAPIKTETPDREVPEKLKVVK